jgi:proliferating cell nuclear antigen PCNA
MSFAITNTELAGKFVAMWKAISTLCDQITVRFTPEGLVAQGMDSSHCSLFEFNVTAQWFATYEAPEHTAVSLDMGIMSKIMSMRQPKQGVEMRAAGDKFEIEYKSEEKDEVNRAFVVPTVDLEAEVMEIPNNEADVDLTLSSTTFAQIISQMSVFGDVIEFQVADEDMTMITEGDAGTMRVGLNDTDLEEFSVTEDLKLGQSFALRYLSMFSGFSKVNSFVRLSLAQDMPVIVRFPLDANVAADPNMDSENYVRLYLAPKINDVDDE